MVKIRYSELPVGLHVRVESDGRKTLIYLLPGLSSEQRKAALLRVRSSARMGQGPQLPALAMTRAITADRLATTAHNGLAATRRHPMLVLPPLVLLVSSAIVLVMLSFVQLTIPVDSQVPNAVPTLPVNDQGTSHGSSSTPPKASVHSAQPSHATGHVYASVIRNGRGQAAASTPSPTPDPSSFLTLSPSTSLSPEPSPAVARSPRVSD